jgi:lysophospholipase L1-like esterase
LNRFKPIRIVSGMRAILCYGDSNTWGCIPLTGPEPPRRLPPDERWPGVLRRELGTSYCVMEEGLNGRTTVWDDGLEPCRNGRNQLIPALLTHHPVDLLILMLGTNDLKRRIGVSASEIAEAAGQLIDLARTSGCGPDGGAPKVLLVAPPPLGRLDQFADEFEGGPEKSRWLARHFESVASVRSCPFLDAGSRVASSDVDGVHLDADAHAALGKTIAPVVRDIVE